MYKDNLEGLRKAYDQKVEERSGKEIALWKKTLNDRFFEMLNKEGKRTLLEIGAGTGDHGAYFQEMGLSVTCTDLSPAMVAYMQSIGLQAYEMDFLNLDFPAASFDAVYGMNCLLHVPHADYQDVLKSVNRVLKPGGVFMLCQYGGIDEEGPFVDDHYEPKRFFALWTDEQIRAEAERVFRLVSFDAIEVPDSSESNVHPQVLILRKFV